MQNDAWFWAALILAMLALWQGRRISELRERLRALETPPKPSAEPSEEVRELHRQGKTIEAIRLYREENPSTGLKEAKDAVERSVRPSPPVA